MIIVRKYNVNAFSLGSQIYKKKYSNSESLLRREILKHYSVKNRSKYFKYIFFYYHLGETYYIIYSDCKL